jgi:hypothetical protein
VWVKFIMRAPVLVTFLVSATRGDRISGRNTRGCNIPGGGNSWCSYIYDGSQIMVFVYKVFRRDEQSQVVDVPERLP